MSPNKVVYDPQNGSIVDGRCVVCRADGNYHDSLHLCDDGKQPPIEDFWYCEEHALAQQRRIDSRLGIDASWPPALQRARRWQARVEPRYPYLASAAEIAEMRERRLVYLAKRTGVDLTPPLPLEVELGNLEDMDMPKPVTSDAVLARRKEDAELAVNMACTAPTRRKLVNVAAEE